MNKVITPNMASIIATENLISFLEVEMETKNIDKARLARIAQVNRKTIYEWIRGVRSPRLENIAQIYAALGYDEIRISLRSKEEKSE